MKKLLLFLLVLASFPAYSQGTKISALSSGAPAQATDNFVIQRGSANFRLSATNLATLILAGNAATATALAANPTDCGSDTYATTIAANGDLTCATVTNAGLAGSIALTKLATQATNTVVGNATSGSAAPTAISMTSCSTSASAVSWTTNTGFGCNTSINAATLGGATFAAPGTIGGGTPAGATFTTLAATTSLNIPHSTTLPATCAVGDSYMDTDATSGARWYLCQSTNTWAVQGGGGGGSGCVPSGSNNQILTDDGSGACASETNLTFNGSTLGVTGSVTVSADVTVTGNVTAANILNSGTLTNAALCTYTSSGTLITCNTTAPAGAIVGTTDSQALTNKSVNGLTVTTSTGTLTVPNGVTLTGPASSGTAATLGNAESFTGIKTFAPTARSSGSSPYLVITTPADTAQAATTESIGISKSAATRQWSAGALATQREIVFAAPTYGFVSTSTLTNAINLDVANPIQGTNATLTNRYSIRGENVLFTGTIRAGSSPVTLTNSTGNILTAALAAPTGNGANVTTSTGALNSGNCVSIDANGNFVDNGAVCGGSGSTGANPSGTIGLSAVNGVATTFLRSDGAPALSQAIVPTWTGVHTFSPAARSSGAAAFLTITTPADTGQTASTESIGVNKTAATRTFATGALTTQREVVLAAPTYAFAGGSTLTTAVNLDIAAPVAGTNATITNNYALRAPTAQFTTSVKAGVAGTTAGSLIFENATSGTITYTAPTGALGTIARTLQAVSGTETVRIAAGTSALATGAITSGTCASAITTTATGTATTDVINWGFNGDVSGVTGYAPATAGMLVIQAYPSSNNVNFKVCNNTTSSVTPGAVTLNWIVIR